MRGIYLAVRRSNFLVDREEPDVHKMFPPLKDFLSQEIPQIALLNLIWQCPLQAFLIFSRQTTRILNILILINSPFYLRDKVT